MPFNFACVCGTLITVEAQAGQKITCTSCGSVLRVPQKVTRTASDPLSRIVKPSKRNVRQSESGGEVKIWKGRRSIKAMCSSLFWIFLLLVGSGLCAALSLADIFPTQFKSFSQQLPSAIQNIQALLTGLFGLAQNYIDLANMFISEYFVSIPYITIYSLLGTILVLIASAKFIKLLLWSYGHRYLLTTRRLVVEKGLVSRNKSQILLIRVKDLNLRQSVIDRFIGIGTIEVISSDETIKDLFVEMINKPNKIYEKLHKAWQKTIHQKGLVMW